MSHILTVQGPIEPEALGFTSMHEHTLNDASVMHRRTLKHYPPNIPVKPEDPVRLENFGFHQHNYGITLDNCRMDDEDWLTAELSDFKESGGDAMVDMSTPGLRLNIPGLKRISERSGVHIIATTGLYAEDSWPERFKALSQDEYAAFMMDEIENGIEDTDIKPGAIKIAVYSSTQQEERVLYAAARVAKETGYSLHIHPGFKIENSGRWIVKVLRREGVDLGRVVIAHSEAWFVEHDLHTLILHPDTWALNLDYHLEVLDQGVNLSIDCFGHVWDEEMTGFILEEDFHRLGGLVALIKRGYSEQIVLGTDTYQKTQSRRGGGNGYCRLTQFAIPTLRDVGVSEHDIRQMTIENPARILAV